MRKYSFLFNTLTACLLVLMYRSTLVIGFYQPSLTKNLLESASPRSFRRSSTVVLSPQATRIETSTIAVAKTYRPSLNTWKQGLRKKTKSLGSSTVRIPKALSLWTKFWWAFPLTLAAFPLYCALQGTCAAMPEWWPVVGLNGIFGAYWWPVIGGFLASNICYFASGVYLVDKFYHRQKFKMLGVWILVAGLVSTLYHTVQSLVGVNAVSETLAYIDHGIALSAGCYYLDTCGWPSKKVLTIGLSGIACLAVCNSAEAYAILHSCWHGLSAAAATIWAIEGYGQKKRQRKLQRIRNFLIY